MKSLVSKAAALLLIFAAGSATADNNFGIGVKAGTLGIGVEGTWRPLPYLDVRFGASSYSYDDDGSQAGVNYDATLDLDNYHLTGNFRFPLSPFRLTAGIYDNGNELSMQSVDSQTFNIGGTTFSAAEVGTLQSVTSFPGTSPYVGIGYDFSLFGKVGLNLDLGVLWQGEPDVTLTADGLLANDPTFQQALETERTELEDEMQDFKAWPVISLGFVYNFL